MELDQSEERIRKIHEDLKKLYGENDPTESKDGVKQLLITILSQNVADINTERAAEQLFNDYTNYKDIENAPIQELADSINPAGLPETKAKRIQRTLKALREETGNYSVEFLDEMTANEAENWLKQIKGIGPKTASVLLNFHFNKNVMPVDTHVERLSKRFRLVPFKASNEKTHKIMNEIVPHELKNSLHILMIKHGREYCQARNPDCEESPIRKYCSRYQYVENGKLKPEEYPDQIIR